MQYYILKICPFDAAWSEQATATVKVLNVLIEEFAAIALLLSTIMIETVILDEF